jgi:hypothetical protein
MQRPPRNPARHLAARMGHWSASHRKLAIFGWLAFVIAAIVIGTAVGTKTIDQSTNNTVGPSARADRILKEGGFKQSGPLTEIAVVQSKHLTIGNPEFQAAMADVARRLADGGSGHPPGLRRLQRRLQPRTHG